MKILLSIRPEYANAIMNGAKTWEFRKKIPKRLCDGSVVVVYSSSPEKMVLGEFTVGRLLMGNLAGGENSRFWKEVDDGAYITWKSLHSYAGEDFVHAIEVKSVTRYDRPLTLNECCPGIKRPPQNFCYIDNSKAMTIREQLEKSLADAFVGKHFTRKTYNGNDEVVEVTEFNVGLVKFKPGYLTLIESPMSTKYTSIPYGLAMDLADKGALDERENALFGSIAYSYTLKEKQQ